MTGTEKLLRDLIALPSVNPAFLPFQHQNAGEVRVAEFLAATAARAGLSVDFLKALPGRSNLLVTLSPPGAVRQRVLLAPHLDTVNATPEQFIPKKAGGRLYGRGACDTKGSIAAMMSALCEVAKQGRRPNSTQLLFIGLVDEENNQCGSRTLAASGFKADLAIVGEPTQCRLVTAHKGSLWMRFETRGKSAHGSRPELGRNAVHEMSKIVNLLETEYAVALKEKRHPLLGQATVNVGVICGGTQPNIVPDRCSILVDRRTLPGETEESVREEIQRLLSRARLRAVCADDKAAPCRALETSPKLALVAECLKVLRQQKPAGVPSFSDAAVLSEGGIPSVLFGPGDIAHAHTADEWVELTQLERAKEFFVTFLRSLP
jgi:acetylornithine deacetylase/succinyl-diaminopimelate desuccinylase-like protein